METEQLVTAITNHLNTFSNKSPDFIKIMSTEHRTLQQAFTKLCFKWIEHIATDEYHTDARNEQSKEVSKLLLTLFKEYQKTQGFNGITLEQMATPSKYLSTI